MKKKKIKLCLTKQLLNMFKLWCEWGIRYKDYLFNNQEFAIISFILVTFMSDSAVKLLIGRNLALLRINPLSLTSDQDRISPYIISTISSRQVMRIKKDFN